MVCRLKTHQTSLQLENVEELSALESRLIEYVQRTHEIKAQFAKMWTVDHLALPQPNGSVIRACILVGPTLGRQRRMTETLLESLKRLDDEYTLICHKIETTKWILSESQSAETGTGHFPRDCKDEDEQCKYRRRRR